MEQKQNQNKKVWIVTLCIVLAAAALFGVYRLAFGNRQEGAKAVRVQVVLADGSQSYDETLHTDAQTLTELLNENELATVEQGTYGSFITGVNGVLADSGKQQWWHIAQNGADAQVGADSLAINDGDTIVLTLKEGY